VERRRQGVMSSNLGIPLENSRAMEALEKQHPYPNPQEHEQEQAGQNKPQSTKAAGVKWIKEWCVSNFSALHFVIIFTILLLFKETIFR
jgi:hypothetical protein